MHCSRQSRVYRALIVHCRCRINLYAHATPLSAQIAEWHVHKDLCNMTRRIVATLATGPWPRGKLRPVWPQSGQMFLTAGATFMTERSKMPENGQKYPKMVKMSVQKPCQRPRPRKPRSKVWSSGAPIRSSGPEPLRELASPEATHFRDASRREAATRLALPRSLRAARARSERGCEHAPFRKGLRACGCSERGCEHAPFRKGRRVCGCSPPSILGRTGGRAADEYPANVLRVYARPRACLCMRVCACAYVCVCVRACVRFFLSCVCV